MYCVCKFHFIQLAENANFVKILNKKIYHLIKITVYLFSLFCSIIDSYTYLINKN